MLAHNAGSGVGPKNNRKSFFLPITRPSSCAMHYTRINSSRIICTAQKCGHTISAAEFLAARQAGQP
jgi:hypothetical protein